MPVQRDPVPQPTTSRRPELFTWVAAFCLSALAVPVCSGQSTTAASLRVQVAPAPALDILEIQPFRLKTGYDFNWLKSRPFVSDGLLVVLKVDPSLVVPRDTGERVLYAGDRTVQRLNKGHGSGFVIGIIPGAIDLASEPIWFGRPQLPARVTPEIIKEERTLADSAGVKPFSPARIDAVRRDGIEATDLAALLRGPAADLVLKYAPDEKHLADTWRLPIAGSKVSR
jgi:hypothetical protein